MTDTLTDLPASILPTEPLGRASRNAGGGQGDRWRQLVGLAADLAFETDAKGRFVFVVPEDALGWPAGSLVGQPSEILVGDDGTGAIVNPFRPSGAMRRHRAWLRHVDGGLTMMTVSSLPIQDAAGSVVGARGIGIDLSLWDTQTPGIAGRLRRLEALDLVLARVGSETGVDRMMDSALWALIHALGAEGAAVIGAVERDSVADVLHECGPGAMAVLATARAMAGSPGTVHAVNPDGRLLLVAGFQTCFGTGMGLVAWRDARGRAWDREEELLASAVAHVVRLVLEYEGVQREMAVQARTDPLTGLLNRRAFLDEISRHIARLDREVQTGTLLYLDLDGFKTVNDRFGHAVGDQVLMHFTAMLRKLVRPSDLIARLGGDEFAVWMSGADRMTAAERSEELCTAAPGEMQALLPAPFPELGVSIGIAMRRAGSSEPVAEVMRRADLAMYEVKRTGRRHWRVSLLDGD